MIYITYVIIAMLSIQYGASLAKQLFPFLGAQGTTTLRLLFATIILFCIFRPWRGKISRLEYRWIIFYGLSLGAMNLLFYFSLERIPLGIAVAVEFTGPLAVALWSSRKALDFVWAFLAVAGIILILPVSEKSVPVDPLGVALALGAGFFWACYIVFGQKGGSTITGGKITSYGMLIATLVALPFGIAHSGAELFNSKYLPIGILVAIFSSAIPYTLEMIGLKKIPTKTFGILMSVEPAVAALMGLIFLQEHLALAQWIAVIFIILASTGSALNLSKRKTVPLV
ncbi:MAG: DMT family transporter [Bdellovibrionota bacterium]